jgi:Ca2+-binding RTX toxin-like protein
VLDGGSNTDTANYSTALSGITLSLGVTTAQNTGGAGIDTLISIENVTGSAFDDTLSGNGATNVILAGDGNDLLFADLGNDTLNGGDGIDTLSFANATLAVRANLSLTTGQNTALGTDIITNIENIIGGDFNDTFTGSAGDNTLDGGLGNDTIQGGLGDDRLIGGDGVDLLTYSAAAAGVTVNLNLLTAQNTGAAGIDTVSGFENLTGSAFADILTGSDDDNTIFGGLSDDIIYGLDGNDSLNGDDGADTLYGGAGSNIINGGNGNDVIYGGSGTDAITGGNGVDIVRYDDDTVGMTISLGAGGGTTGLSAGDTYNTIEGIYGGSGNDVITGNSGANIFYGFGGNDSLNGGGGADTLVGGLGVDTLTGGTASDRFIFDDLLSADVVTDFSRSQGDVLFLDDIITGFVNGVSDINEFVLFTTSGGNTNVFVDSNGAVGGTAWTQIATLNNITTLNVTTMFGNNTLIID